MIRSGRRRARGWFLGAAAWGLFRRFGGASGAATCRTLGVAPRAVKSPVPSLIGTACHRSEVQCAAAGVRFAAARNGHFSRAAVRMLEALHFECGHACGMTRAGWHNGCGFSWVAGTRRRVPPRACHLQRGSRARLATSRRTLRSREAGAFEFSCLSRPQLRQRDQLPVRLESAGLETAQVNAGRRAHTGLRSAVPGDHV